MNSSFLENECSELSIPNPLMGRRKFCTSITQLEDRFLSDLDQSFKKHLMKRGRIFLSTALRNIQYSSHSLKNFSVQIAKDINLSESENSDSFYYQVDMMPVKSHVLHPYPLKVIVKRSSYKNQEETDSVVYVGIFYTWRTNITPCQEYLNLPFLFSTGSQKFTDLMNDLFQKYFGCIISAVLFSQHEIKWLLAIIIHYVCLEADTEKSIQMVYHTDSNDLKIDFSVSFNHMRDIWNTIHDETKDEIRHEEIVTLYHAFNEHVQETLGFDLNHFLLKRFIIPDVVTIDIDGKIKIFRTEVLDLIFRFLKDKTSFSQSNAQWSAISEV